MSYRLRPAVRGPATRRRPERTGAPSSRQRRARIPSASPQPRDPAASRPQGTRGGASGAVTADASRASTRDRGSRTARRHARRFPAGVLGSHCPVSTTRPEGDVCPALPRSPGQPGTAARAPLLLLGRSGDAVVPRLAGVQLGRGQAHGVQRTRRQLLRLRGGLPHTCRSHVSRPRCGSLPLCRGTRPVPAACWQAIPSVHPAAHLGSRPVPRHQPLPSPSMLDVLVNFEPGTCHLLRIRKSWEAPGTKTGASYKGETQDQTDSSQLKQGPQHGLFIHSL